MCLFSPYAARLSERGGVASLFFLSYLFESEEEGAEGRFAVISIPHVMNFQIPLSHKIEVSSAPSAPYISLSEPLLP